MARKADSPDRRSFDPNDSDFHIRAKDPDPSWIGRSSSKVSAQTRRGVSAISRRQFLRFSSLIAVPLSITVPSTAPGETSLFQPSDDRERRSSDLGDPRVGSSLANAVVIKNGNVCFVADADGMVPLTGGHGFGLYYHDCRFLSGYVVRLAGKLPVALSSAAACPVLAKFELTNPRVRTSDGEVLCQDAIGIAWQRVVDDARPALHDRFLIKNFGRRRAEFLLSFSFRAAFEDVYDVRDALSRTLGVLHPPTWRNGVLGFLYEGKDGFYRSLGIQFSPSVEVTGAQTAHIPIMLEPKESTDLRVSLLLAESRDPHDAQASVRRPSLPEKPDSEVPQASAVWSSTLPRIISDNLVLNKVIARSFVNLGLLRSQIDHLTFFAAGTPWFATLFGRDSLIAALQTLAYDPSVAEQTLRLLAKYQGRQDNSWRDEEPGKILHELRMGEMARLGLIPQTPYYGSIDATPLFLILIGRHAAWTGSLDLFHELQDSVDRALVWLETTAHRYGHGYLAYMCRSEQSSANQGWKPLDNQGWKDSGEAIVNTDDSLAAPPIALVEVQGYVYRAKLAVAQLYERARDVTRAARLRREASDLRARFNRDFWIAERGFYAMALQGDGRPAAVISSNPGQALWSGIVEENKAKRTVDRLMSDEMFSGWGIRTLSEREQAYNPLGYHIGSVWPHDNSLIAMGFRRYGYDQAACRVFDGLLEAAMHFKSYRLPELFAGFSRSEYEVPVPYAAANPPQAWAAGAVPYLLEAVLGLVPEAFDRRLRIVRPTLPNPVDELHIQGMEVGPAQVDLRYERTRDGTVRVHVLKVDGALDVVVEQV